MPLLNAPLSKKRIRLRKPMHIGHIWIIRSEHLQCPERGLCFYSEESIHINSQCLKCGILHFERFSSVDRAWQLNHLLIWVNFSLHLLNLFSLMWYCIILGVRRGSTVLNYNIQALDCWPTQAIYINSQCHILQFERFISVDCAWWSNHLLM